MSDLSTVTQGTDKQLHSDYELGMSSRVFTMWKTLCICSLVLLFFPGIGACFGQTVCIRIVNEADKRPLENQQVLILGITSFAAGKNVQREMTVKPIKYDLRLSSDANGEAQFELPKPAPEYFYVRAVLSGPVWDCPCAVRVSTRELVQKGLTIRNAPAEAAHTRPPIQPKPRQVLFSVRPTPLWERILYPIAK